MKNITQPEAPRNPRSPTTPAVIPLFVTQHTASAVIGCKNSRAFLEFVALHALPHTRVGKTVFVDVEVIRTKLRELASHNAVEPIDDGDDDVPASPDAVLAALGLRRTA